MRSAGSVGLGLDRQCALNLDDLAALRLLIQLLASSSGSASSFSTTLTPISLNMARTSSICSVDLLGDGTALIWSTVT